MLKETAHVQECMTERTGYYDKTAAESYSFPTIICFVTRFPFPDLFFNAAKHFNDILTDFNSRYSKNCDIAKGSAQYSCLYEMLRGGGMNSEKIISIIQKDIQ